MSLRNQKIEAGVFLLRLNGKTEYRDIEVSQEIYLHHREFLQNLPMRFQPFFQQWVDEVIDDQYRTIWLGHIIRSISAGRTVGLYLPVPGDESRIRTAIQGFIDS